MPEFVEAEAYRRTLDPIVGATVAAVDVRDERLLRRDPTGPDAARDRLTAALAGERIESTRRIGKVVLADVSSGHTVAFGFGLRGRFVLDGHTASPTGEPTPVTSRAEHVRLTVDVDPIRTAAPVAGVRLALEDQLRLATVDLDIDESRLGVDVLALDVRTLRTVVGSTAAAVKSVLMDQRRIAGIGNLIADEMLYQGGIDPRRSARDLADGDVDRLWVAIRRTRSRVLALGGSHRGVLIDRGARRRGADCPRCGAPIRRVRVGGRTSYFCPAHQH